MRAYPVWDSRTTFRIPLIDIDLYNTMKEGFRLLILKSKKKSQGVKQILLKRELFHNTQIFSTNDNIKNVLKYWVYYQISNLQYSLSVI